MSTIIFGSGHTLSCEIMVDTQSVWDSIHFSQYLLSTDEDKKDNRSSSQPLKPLDSLRIYYCVHIFCDLNTDPDIDSEGKVQALMTNSTLGFMKSPTL
ncbi:hypothetical protein STEG23_010346 [Scotinomys teguina]